jgi:ribonuclease III
MSSSDRTQNDGAQRGSPPYRVLEERLGHVFSNIDHLRTALTHRSHAHETRSETIRDNERLEFLGDAVLDLAVGHLLMERYRTADEGALSRARASVVSETSLAQVARDIELGRWLLLGKGEESTGGREKSSLLADALEAVFAAIYLDAGFSKAMQSTAKLLEGKMELSAGQELRADAKSRLQEHVQARYRIRPRYRLAGESGPEHDKRFHAEVALWDHCLASGKGKTKKEAEQDAARRLLAAIEKGEIDLDALLPRS